MVPHIVHNFPVLGGYSLVLKNRDNLNAPQKMKAKHSYRPWCLGAV